MEKPWLRFYEEKVPFSIDYPPVPMTYLFDEAVRKGSDTPALIFFGNRITYGQLNRWVERFAGALHHLGIKKGDRVAIILPNLPQYPIAHFALMRLGAIIVPTNPMYVERELAYQLRDSGAVAAIVLDLIYHRLKAAWPRTQVKQVIVTGVKEYLPPLLKLLYPLKEMKEGIRPKVEREEGVHLFSELMRRDYGAPPEVKLTPDDTALFLYTGGTTGISKGAILTHRNIVANVFQTKSWMSDIQDGKEMILSVLPFFHSYGMTACLHLAVLSRSTQILLPRFDTKQVLKAIHRYRVTIFPGVPTMYVAINNYPEVRKYDLSSIRACVSGGASLPGEVQRRFEEMTGGKLVEGYGLSEASPVTHVNPLYGRRKEGSIGIPLPDTEARVVDLHTREPLPPGEAGELAVRGPQVMKGYWNKPEETTRVFHGDWLLTGDIARMDEDGYFYLVDRKKDIIVTRGYNVYPREVEEILYTHPKVMEAAVIGVPDQYLGEKIKAFVVLKEGETATEDELIQFCQGKLAKYKLPKAVEFRKELPKSLIGKVLRRVLAEEERAKLQKAAVEQVAEK